VLPSIVFEVRYYLSEDGRSPFEEWFSSVDSAARAKVAAAIARLEQGNTRTSNWSAKEYLSTASISGLDTACILAVTARRW
jgi:hypothetical protein